MAGAVGPSTFAAQLVREALLAIIADKKKRA